MELIIFIAVVVVAALLWVGHVKATQSQAESKIDAWKPLSTEQPWPYGEKIAEGKIHVKSAELSGSENRVEAPAPGPKCGCGRSPTGFCVGLHKLTPEEWAASDQNPNRVSGVAVEAMTTVVENKPAKKPPAKKPAAKKPAVKKAPAKKKSV